MSISIQLINGMALGLEHLSGESDEDIAYLLVLHFFVFRFVLIKYNE